MNNIVAEEMPVLNKELAVGRLDGDEELWRELILMCLEEVQQYVLEIESALSLGDAETAFRHAHTLKSASANIGAVRVSEISRVMEKACRESNLNEAREGLPVLAEEVVGLLSECKRAGLTENAS